ncbi:MAG: hypothetical protein FWB72_03850 [Firmicutes bacterium]|nr:hypothetical protein [Bacillota bacterium]
MFTVQQFKDKREFLLGLAAHKDETYIIENAASNVLISAPHFVRQVRLGRIKSAEPTTGSLAIILNELTNCNVIIKVANESNDANFDERSVYKTKMRQLIKKHNITKILDLHSLAEGRDEIVNVGIYHGSLLQTPEKEKKFDTLMHHFKTNGLDVRVDNPFAASPRTLTYYFGRDKKLFVTQIESNTKIFTYTDYENVMNNFISAIKNFIVGGA